MRTTSYGTAGNPRFPSDFIPISQGIFLTGNNDRNIAGTGTIHILGDNIGDIFCIGDVDISGDNFGNISATGKIFIGNSNAGHLKSDKKVQILGDNTGDIAAKVVQIFGTNTSVNITANDYLFTEKEDTSHTAK